MTRASRFTAIFVTCLAVAALAGCSGTKSDPATTTGGTTATTTGTTAHDMGGMAPGQSMPTTTHDMGGMKPSDTMAPGK